MAELPTYVLPFTQGMPGGALQSEQGIFTTCWYSSFSSCRRRILARDKSARISASDRGVPMIGYTQMAE